MEIKYASYTEYIPIALFEKNCADAYIWGPELWKIYHGLCQLPENIKYLNSTLIIEFINISLELLLCAYCQKKLIEYINNDKIPNTIDLVEIWLWDLHNNINDINNKSIILFTDENKIRYQNISLKKSLNTYLHQLYLALDLKWIDYNIWHSFRNIIIPQIEAFII